MEKQNRIALDSEGQPDHQQKCQFRSSLAVQEAWKNASVGPSVEETLTLESADCEASISDVPSELFAANELAASGVGKDPT